MLYFCAVVGGELSPFGFMGDEICQEGDDGVAIDFETSIFATFATGRFNVREDFMGRWKGNELLISRHWRSLMDFLGKKQKKQKVRQVSCYSYS